MRRLLVPLIGMPAGLALGVFTVLWSGSDRARIATAPVAAESSPVLAAARPPQHAVSLPKVGPFPADRLRPPVDATTQASGTGFFAAARTVITAAHVVSDCRAIRLVSQHLLPTEARLVAVDAENDIAVLQSAAPAPANLTIADYADAEFSEAGAAAAPARVLVYGFPATARRDVPNTTWASLVNDSFDHSAPLEKNPRTLLWMQNRDIAQGYSGGPILNPANGQVLGIVRALIDPARAAAAYGIVTPNLSIGPGSAPLRAILAADTLDRGAAADDTDDIFSRASKATVHVVCWQ